MDNSLFKLPREIKCGGISPTAFLRIIARDGRKGKTPERGKNSIHAREVSDGTGNFRNDCTALSQKAPAMSRGFSLSSHSGFT